MYPESELLPLSGLQHLAYCERQWALIHLEQQWAENRLTAEGRQMHERAHEGPDETREGVRICRGLALRSFRLGLVGKADVVEFRSHSAGGVSLFPIEYKHGRPKPDHTDEVQLCAQALCLEEMLKQEVPCGAFYYGRPRRRSEVIFDNTLRSTTEALARRMHELYAAQKTPAAQYGPKCDRCSLFDICLPKTAGEHRSADVYAKRAFAAALKQV